MGAGTVCLEAGPLGPEAEGGHRASMGGSMEVEIRQLGG